MDFSLQNRLRIGLQSLMLLQVRISVRIYIYPRGVKFSQEYCLVQAHVLELELWMLFHCVMYKFKLSWMSSVICVAPNFCHVIWKLLQNETKSQHFYRTHHLWHSLRVVVFLSYFPLCLFQMTKMWHHINEGRHIQPNLNLYNTMGQNTWFQHMSLNQA